MELYKYMPYRNTFFENPLLCFTALSDFNDPFEGQIQMSSLDSVILKSKNLDGKSFETTYTEAPKLKQDLSNIRKIDMHQNLGVLSLSRSKHSLLMWAHYANNHEGIVVGFDSEHPFFNQNILPTQTPSEETSFLGKLHPVVYDRVRPGFKIGSKSLQSILRKSDEWIYEKEYRMFMRREDCDDYGKDASGNINDRINLFKAPAEAITRIIMGERSDSERILGDFIDALNGNPNLSHILIEKAILHRDLYHLEHDLVYKHGETQGRITIR